MATQIEVTGDFWKYDADGKPWGEFDTDAELTFPFSLDKWIEDPDASIETATPNGYGIFQIATPVIDGRKMLVKIKVADDAQYVNEIKYPFSIKFKDTNDETDERTWYLLLKNR